MKGPPSLHWKTISCRRWGEDPRSQAGWGILGMEVQSWPVVIIPLLTLLKESTLGGKWWERGPRGSHHPPSSLLKLNSGQGATLLFLSQIQKPPDTIKPHYLNSVELL